MRNLPIVAVLITIFNVRNLLKKAIMSVLKRNYPLIQIIFVYDGSTDYIQNMIQLLCSE